MGLRIAAIFAGHRTDGGAEALFRMFATQLQSSEHQLELFTTSKRPRKPESIAQLSELGVPFHDMSASSMFSPTRMARLVRHLKRFDVVQTHLAGPNIIGSIAAQLAGVGSLAVLHNAKTNADDHLYHGQLEAQILRRLPRRLVAVGPATRDARAKLLPGAEIHTLANAVEPGPDVSGAGATALRCEVMADPGNDLLLSVGRLHEQKAHDVMIEAMVQVVEERVATELVIAGRGGLEADLRRQIENLGLADHVSLIGSRTDVRRLMAVADLFVMPSRWEGLPIALLEALDAGLPAVVTAVGDIPSVVDDRSAWIIDEAEPSVLAEAILDALNAEDRDERGRRAQSRVRSDFGAGSWTAAMIEHLEACMA